MNFGHTKTKLDYILELGFRRIDEAVESVIQRIAPDSSPIKSWIIRACVICGKENPERHQSFCVDLGCSGLIRETLSHYSDHKLLGLCSLVSIEDSPLLESMATKPPPVTEWITPEQARDRRLIP